jgi:hypothetical protein
MSDIIVEFGQQEIIVDFGGPPVPHTIGGYPIIINQDIQENDLVQFKSGSYWSNSAQTNITDGGNF